LLGQGVFGKCYIASVGPLRTCAKIFKLDQDKYFCKEARMLLQLCHENLPWIIAACNDSSMKAIIMSYHSFCGMHGSLTVHTALKKDVNPSSGMLTRKCWNNILLGMTSALVYLKNNNILHNDIKSDNILVEFSPPDENTCRSILIDFGKACFVSEAVLYNLSSEQKDKYKKCHPQIAPEVRNGISRQSFCSDIYSFARVLQQINLSKLNIPVISSLSEQCLTHCYQERPTCEDLHIFFTNLFEKIN